MNANPPPDLEPGTEHELAIDDLAFGGDGVGRLSGVPVFVPDVAVGERVRVRLREVRGRYARGELLAVLQPSPDRVPPTCPLVGTCGGCQLQHLDVAAQRAAKAGMVRENLRRVGHLPDVPVAEPVPSPRALGYRNKADFACFAPPGEPSRPALGFHARDGRSLIEVAECPLCRPELNALLKVVAGWLQETGWPVYDPRTGAGLVRGVGLRVAPGGEATVLLTTGRREVVDKAPRIRELRRRAPQIVGVRHFVRTRASQTALGKPQGNLEGRALRFPVAGLSLRVAPECFFQVNEAMLEPMIAHLREALQPGPKDHLADLYAGVGTFGLALAGEVERVSLVEVDRAAMHDAEANAQHAGLTNVALLRGQVEQQIAGVLGGGPVAKVVLDPPRAGCTEAVLRFVARCRPRRIAYVSCDPATLARDLARLRDAGYDTLGVQPFDLFPQTTHIECIATLKPGTPPLFSFTEEPK